MESSQWSPKQPQKPKTGKLRAWSTTWQNLHTNVAEISEEPLAKGLWDDAQTRASEKIKAVITNAPNATPLKTVKVAPCGRKTTSVITEIRHHYIPVSDYLSRHSVNDTYPTLIDGSDTSVHSVRKKLLVTDRRLEIIRQQGTNTQSIVIASSSSGVCPPPSLSC
ncbi:hypothetical protein DPMN_111040 [Dreissena polymorpha]|uniref:Uncharacterized protein n=1 Tax=Dreissena polymorpha TaxID=45954 RepID=A0A9D4KDQ1_DREPO|nr:hypothetical protein DPMN_111040 [Dreissena polymorpha]